MARIAVVGCGVTGANAARHIVHLAAGHELVLVDRDVDKAAALARSLPVRAPYGSSLSDEESVDVALLAVAAGDHVALAEKCLSLGQHVVSVSDSIDDVDGLLSLDSRARELGALVIVGAGMMPGLSDVLALHAAAWFDDLREIHVSKFGTGGPDCARQHHRALKGVCLDWRQEWQRRPGGSGRELAWFPPPVQAADCYRARLGDPKLLLRAHPDVERITARMAATRRDRLTMHLPMLRPPHPEGLLGAVRVELRGMIDGAQTEVVLGCSGRPAVAAGVIGALAVDAIATSDHESGSAGLAEVVEPLQFLSRVRNAGLRPEIFIGTDQSY